MRNKTKRKIHKSIKMIKDARRKLGVSRYKVSQIASVDQKYYTALERGESSNPGRSVLLRLARTITTYSKLYDEKWVDKVLSTADFPPAPEPHPDDWWKPRRNWAYFEDRRDDLRIED